MSDLITSATADVEPRAVDVPSPETSPVKRIDKERMRMLAMRLSNLFDAYKKDRLFAEERWLRNQRQYLGIYDPDIEKQLTSDRSKAYPKITRVKCISVLARLMNLMFPGNESNWELKASPSPDMKLDDVKGAIAKAQKKDQGQGVQSEVDDEYVQQAVNELAAERAKKLSVLIDDQLQELGGDQTSDYVSLNRKAIASGILYGLGVIRGPYVRTAKSTVWGVGDDGAPAPKTRTIYKPLFEFIPVWDFYPDMSTKNLKDMDGYFTREVMSRSQVRDLCDREDFFEDKIRDYLNGHPTGNYTVLNYETQLRTMGVKMNVNEQKGTGSEGQKYEIIVWHGPIEGQSLRDAGAEVADNKLADDIDAEVWILDGNIIKCEMNPWRALDVDVKTVHTFLFDEDDTSPIGQGLPNVIRDSQMSIAAAVRMLLDNASVVCGPNIEVNVELLRPGQDFKNVHAYKVWEREGTGPDAQWPAVRNIEIDAHLEQLIQVVDLFMKFADAETFVGPATGGDMSKAPSEPMRTAAGASMLRGDAALPFKDIVRSFDSFTQSVIEALVQFNKKFNEEQAQEGDYNVIARGASSLIAKELRGMQIDQLATTQTDAEKQIIDQKKLARARLEVRDLGDLIKSDADIMRDQKAAEASASDQADKQKQLMEANIRKLLSDAYKNVTQGQKNAAMGNAAEVKAALELLERALNDNLNAPAAGAGGPDQTAQSQPDNSGGAGLPAPADPAAGGGQGQGLAGGPGLGLGLTG